MKYRYNEKEDDFVVEPKGKHNYQKEEDWDWYPYKTPSPKYKPKLMMAPQKKWELEEYNFQRTYREMEEKAQKVAKECLEEKNIPRDIIDDILTRAGFYIPHVLVFGK